MTAVVAGAGVIGLSLARALSRRGYEAILLEINPAIGMETSSRNSEVIHAGLYYEKDSLKAKTCVEGRELLYHYCNEHNVPYSNCGKIIVATDEDQLETLDLLYQKSLANNLVGEDKLSFLTGEQIKSLEPSIRAISGLFSPSTGIVDSHELLYSLLADAEKHGTVLCCNTRVVTVDQTAASPLKVHIESLVDNSRSKFEADLFFNCTGLLAPILAKTISPHLNLSTPLFAKGNYFKLNYKPNFNHLVYPVPFANNAGLGVHLTLDLAGNAKFGPDLEWVDELDYNVSTSNEPDFYRSIRTYYPELRNNSLIPDYAGIRPKLSSFVGKEQDFVVERDENVFHLLGIDSPGFTASLALSELVCDQI